MDPLTVAAASGLRSRMDTLELLANNLANAETSGYKSDREFYGLYASPEADNPLGPGFAEMLPVVERQWTDFAQGSFQTTGSPLDVAISGRGFFAANGPSGPVYTRNGSLKLSRSGELVTGEGYPLRTVGNKTIKVVSDTPLNITKDGTVRQDGQVLGQLEIVDFKSTDSLKKMNGAVFQNTDPANAPLPASNVQLEQGKTESSNVSVPESAMRLVNVMRQFEMLQKAVVMNGDMNRNAIAEVARVGQ